MPVFGADIFAPWAQPAPISYSRRPGHREGAFILDGEVELESFPPVIKVCGRSRITSAKELKIFLCITVCRFLGGLVIKQPVAFHDMQGWAVRRAVHIDHCKWPDFDPHGVDHQCIAFIMADGIPIPGWYYIRRMSLVHGN